MILVERLTKTYPGGTRSALDDVSLTVAPGEFLAVVGRSGSGKTTLLNLVGGLDRGYQGRLEVDGRELARLGDRELSRLRNRTFGFVFQAFHLLPHLSVLENVLLPSQFADDASRADAPRRAAEALERVGLTHLSDRPPTRLSAGERQRVAVARAILNRPAVLLCDEPTGNLDARTGAQVLEIFLELNRVDGTTLVIATHEARVSRAASRRVILEAGRVVEGPDPTMDAGDEPGGTP